MLTSIHEEFFFYLDYLCYLISVGASCLRVPVIWVQDKREFTVVGYHDSYYEKTKKIMCFFFLNCSIFIYLYQSFIVYSSFTHHQLINYFRIILHAKYFSSVINRCLPISRLLDLANEFLTLNDSQGRPINVTDGDNNPVESGAFEAGLV